jgi:hypothetical protein
MTHAYHIPIQVERSTTRKDSAGDYLPMSFVWRGKRYKVLHTNEPWHLADRWWEAPEIPGVRKGHTDRIYYRAQARADGHRYEIFCEFYYDRVAEAWVMARV